MRQPADKWSYWFHPESDSYFKVFGEISEELEATCIEITKETYEELLTREKEQKNVD